MSIFTEIYEKKPVQFMFDTRHFFVLWNAYPVSPGHAMVIPKREIEVLPLLNKDEWDGLLPAILKTIQTIENTDKRVLYEKFLEADISKSETMINDLLMNSKGMDKKPDGYNQGVNNGEAAGQTVFHLHWHVIPRYEGDVEDPRGGILHVMPGKGNYKKFINE